MNARFPFTRQPAAFLKIRIVAVTAEPPHLKYGFSFAFTGPSILSMNRYMRSGGNCPPHADGSRGGYAAKRRY